MVVARFDRPFVVDRGNHHQIFRTEEAELWALDGLRTKRAVDHPLDDPTDGIVRRLELVAQHPRGRVDEIQDVAQLLVVLRPFAENRDELALLASRACQPIPASSSTVGRGAILGGDSQAARREGAQQGGTDVAGGREVEATPASRLLVRPLPETLTASKRISSSGTTPQSSSEDPLYHNAR